MCFYALSNGQSVATDSNSLIMYSSYFSVSMPFLTGSLLQRKRITKSGFESDCFYALSNGQSVATRIRKKMGEGCSVSMPFLTGSLLQQKIQP